MTEAKKGNRVKVHYTGKLEDGTVFDTSKNREPLEFTIGENSIIPGFEEAVVGMSKGESKSAKSPADKAYGPHHEAGVMVVERTKFPKDIEPKVGLSLQLTQEDGKAFAVTIAALSDSNVTLDANHPLAGKDLLFEIELLEVA